MNRPAADNGEIEQARKQAEEKLLSRLRNGDHSAREDIFSLYFDSLYTHVFHSVGRDKSAAEDITQDTFLAVFKSLKSFDGNSRLYTWIVSIAHHKIADYYRRAKKERPRESVSLGNNDTDTPSTDMPVHDSLESIETRVLVTRALAGLDPDHRQVLLLKYVEDMTVAEICQVMKRSQKSVEGLLMRARAKLRNLIGDTRE